MSIAEAGISSVMVYESKRIQVRTECKRIPKRAKFDRKIPELRLNKDA